MEKNCTVYGWNLWPPISAFMMDFSICIHRKSPFNCSGLHVSCALSVHCPHTLARGDIETRDPATAWTVLTPQLSAEVQQSVRAVMVVSEPSWCVGTPSGSFNMTSMSSLSPTRPSLSPTMTSLEFVSHKHRNVFYKKGNMLPDSRLARLTGH